VHVVLAGMPRLLKEIVRSVLDEDPGVDLAVRDLAPSLLGADESLSLADVMIVADDAPLSADYESVLYAHPRLRLVAISSQGANAFLYELRPRCISLGELSPTTLLRAIRSPKSGMQEPM
jgi:hypothetical protein